MSFLSLLSGSAGASQAPFSRAFMAQRQKVESGSELGSGSHSPGSIRIPWRACRSPDGQAHPQQ